MERLPETYCVARTVKQPYHFVFEWLFLLWQRLLARFVLVEGSLKIWMSCMRIPVNNYAYDNIGKGEDYISMDIGL